jgi:3-oxoacyl-[acyl-carrier-protein] synthase-1
LNKVVITGIGIHSCLGSNLDQVTQSLREGKSGIVYDQERKDFGYRSALTGAVETPMLKGLLHRRLRIGLSQEAEYAYLSTQEALAMSKMDADFLEKNEVGIIFGNDSSALAVVEATDLIREKKDTTLVGSGSVFRSMNSTISMNLSTIHKLKGINFTVSGACASGSHSIGLGFTLIRQGLQDQVICGGAQEVNLYAFGNFDGISAFSTRESEPTLASRPFDKDRDGLVPSGGAATVILESEESANKRGATILAEVVGYGFSSNGDHISKPNIEGPSRSLKRALESAQMEADQIDYINAHATSTPLGDYNEAEAITKIFGGCKPLVSSTKSMTGHECWMAGASEVVYSMLMMKNGFIAPNINFSEPDDASAKLNLVTETMNKDFDVFLSNSFGFGGTNSSLIIKKV